MPAGDDVNQEVTTNPENATREHSFDELTKGLASGSVSRRKVLRMMGGALVGGLLASIPGVALAQGKPAPCPSGKKCGRNCCPHASFVCSRGKCACPTGTTSCGGQCVDPTIFQTDPSNCGSCGNVCAGGKTCQAGGCACPAGQTDCGGVCRDLATDELNCGICGSACGTGQSCVGGQCVCPTGSTLCPGNNSCVQNCPSGQTLNTNTCQCEAVSTCSDVSCCCSCIYEDPVTGSRTQTCNIMGECEFVGGGCHTLCTSNVPQGLVFVQAHGGCTGLGPASCVSAPYYYPANKQSVCQPARSGEIPGTHCDARYCCATDADCPPGTGPCTNGLCLQGGI